MNRVLLTLLGVVLVAGCRDRDKNWTGQLHEALQGVTHLCVRSGGTCHRQPDQEKNLLDLRDPKQVADFIKGIQINSRGSGFHCMCCGEPTLEFYRGDVLVVSLGFHHGQSLRWPNGKWAGDALLTQDSAGFIIQWLADHDVTGPQKEREERIRFEKESAISQEKWLKAMPDALKPFWGDIGDPFGSNRTKIMDAALAKQFPDPKTRILALLSLYGSGQGKWSGVPSYELFAEQLLLLHKTEDLLAAVQNRQLTEEQTEGLARLLGGWAFSRQRPDDLRFVPADLKARLLKHSLQSKYEDKCERARNAFEEKK